MGGWVKREADFRLSHPEVFERSWESNSFSLVLFTFFLVINGVATMAWIKATPKEKYGWLKK